MQINRAGLAAVVCLFCCSSFAQDQVSLDVVHQIKTEAFDNSKVMETLSYITDVYGPRLTGSPEYKEAADWAVKRMQQFGLSNAHQEKWGPFGRSWSLKQYSVELIEPRYSLMNATPLAWTANTQGPVTGELIVAPLKSTFNPKEARESLEKFEKEYAGKLRGKIVLLSAPKVSPQAIQALLKRWTDSELAERAVAPAPVAKIQTKFSDLKFPDDPEEFQKMVATLPESVFDDWFEANVDLQTRRNNFLRSEGAIGVLIEDQRAHYGMAFGEQAGSHRSKDSLALPTFVVTAEHYNRLTRLLEKNVPARVRINLQATVSDQDVDGLNVIGEIPGGAKKDEIVMVGAHFDSWHNGTGATDNGAGSAVMLEVMRILKALNLKMDRTVRIALWSGEEQGLYGSKAYVREHFGDPKTMKLTSQHAKLSGYFNLDNGSGKIRGVYLQGHDAMRPMFERWLAPFRDQGVTTITIRNTGGTDHLSFDEVGLPGFQFIQDPLDYGTITHHSSMDTYDHAIPEDLMQASAVIASVVYNAANQQAMLPRKPLPKVSAPEPKSAAATN